jgi:hypothetical protein
MGLRFTRRLGVIPGVRLNFSKSGVSLSLGRRGAHFTVGPKGTRETVGLPGTGLYWTEEQGWRNKPSQIAPQPRGRWGWLIWPIAAMMLAFALHGIRSFP